MTKFFTSALSAAAAPLPVPVLCSCVNFLAEECLAKRWQIGMDLAKIMNGCNCPCHVASNGNYMPAGVWAANREQKRRDIARVKALNENRYHSQNHSQKKKEIR